MIGRAKANAALLDYDLLHGSTLCEVKYGLVLIKNVEQSTKKQKPIFSNASQNIYITRRTIPSSPFFLFLERERWRLWLVNGRTTLTHLNYEGSILHLMRYDSAFPRQRRKNGGSKQQKFRFHFHHPLVLNSKFIFSSV